MNQNSSKDTRFDQILNISGINFRFQTRFIGLACYLGIHSFRWMQPVKVHMAAPLRTRSPTPFAQYSISTFIHWCHFTARPTRVLETCMHGFNYSNTNSQYLYIYIYIIPISAANLVHILPLEMGFLIISLIILYEFTKTKAEPGISDLRTSTSDFKCVLKRWAARFSPCTHASPFDVTVGLHPSGFTDINTNFRAPRLNSFCINNVRRNIWSKTCITSKDEFLSLHSRLGYRGIYDFCCCYYYGCCLVGLVTCQRPFLKFPKLKILGQRPLIKFGFDQEIWHPIYLELNWARYFRDRLQLSNKKKFDFPTTSLLLRHNCRRKSCFFKRTFNCWDSDAVRLAVKTSRSLTLLLGFLRK